MIGSWYCIPERELSRDALGEYAAAGFTHFQTLDLDRSSDRWRPFSPEGIARALSLCEEVGLGCIVVDRRTYRDGRPLETGDAITVEAIDDVLASFGSSSSLSGLLLYDEPSPHMFPLLAPAIARLRERRPDLVALVPLFPMHDDPRFPNAFEGRDYEAYLREFVAVCRPAVLAYDYYPFFDREARVPQWILNFEIARRVADDAGLPLWYYAGIVEPPGAETATIGRCCLQVNMALAYGARALLHYTYRAPAPGQDGPVDVDGRRNSTAWERIQRVNRSAAALLEATSSWTSLEVWHGDPRPLGARPVPPGVEVSRDATLAVLGDDVPRGLLLLNRDPERARTVSASWRGRTWATALEAGGASVLALT